MNFNLIYHQSTNILKYGRSFYCYITWPCLFLVIILVTQSIPANSQGELENYYDSFNQLTVPTGFLLNRSFFSHQMVEPYILNNNTNDLSERIIFSSPLKWRLLYNNMIDAEMNSPSTLEPLSSFYSMPKENDSTVHIGIIFIDSDYIHSDSLEFYFNAIDSTVLDSAPMDTVNIFSISNLRENIFFKDVKFIIDPSMLFTNRNDTIIGIEIDFGNGEGSQFFTISYNSINVKYDSEGEKSLTYKLITKQDTLISYSKIKILPRCSPNSSNSYTITLPDGSHSTGYYNTYLGCDNILDKTIIVIEGFDPLEEANPAKLCRKFSGNDAGISDGVYNSGYDLITVAFENNNDSIQNNAKILEGIIKEINNSKVGFFENIIIGESMGGLIVRVALKEMELKGVPHRTRLYVSFDSPHKGSNIPLSLQSFADGALNNWLADFIDGVIDFISFITFGEVLGNVDSFIDDFEETVKANNSAAARQMLIRHMDFGHVTNKDFEDFQTYIDSIGFPTQLRKIALVNGSNGSIQQIDSSGNLEIGEKYININAEKFGTGLIAYADVSPINEDTILVSRIRLRGLFIPLVNKRGWFSFFDKPYDISPGGVQSFKGIGFSFVPTISSIALKNEVIQDTDGLFFFNNNLTNSIRTRKGMVLNKLTPFDDIYSQKKNTEHVKYYELSDLASNMSIKEFMFDDFYVQNRTIQALDTIYFHGNTSTVLGKDVNPWKSGDDEKLIETGRFIAESQSKTQITAGERIVFSPGTSIKRGASMIAKIVAPPDDCPQNKSAVDDFLAKHIVSSPVINIQELGNGSYKFSVANKSKMVSDRDYKWVLMGMGVDRTTNGTEWIADNLSTGQYSISCSLFEGRRGGSKVFAVKNNLPKFKPTYTEQSKTIVFSDNQNITVYPNPSSGEITLSYEMEEAGFISAEIVDSYGRNTKTLINQSREQGHYKDTFDFSNMSKGLYFLKMKINGEVNTIKMIFY